MIGLDHVNIRCADQEAMRDFLVDVLGLKEGFRPPFDFPGFWLYLGDQPIVHLQSTERSPTTSPTGWVDHLAFGPFDFDAQCQRLDARGVAYTIAGIPDTGIRQIFVPGPEGSKFELQCPPKA